jgi:hypothetical protein
MDRTYPLVEFQQELEQALRKQVKLRINNNRSTMLSVKWEPKCTRVSMHRFFLEAPKNIMDELACYIKRELPQLTPSVKTFIEERVNQLDYTHQLKIDHHNHIGCVYNLKQIMDKVNHRYFDGEMDLNITWFEQKRKRYRSQFTFGLYYHPMRLVKINRMLDRIDVPEYILSFVVYHEMLHHAYPSYCDVNGKRKVHHREFKSMEKKFHAYDHAMAWIEQNRERLINMR